MNDLYNQIMALLPKEMQAAIKALEKLYNVPFELSIQVVLAVANYAAQAHYNVLAYWTDEPIPLSGFFVPVARSGGLKSTVFKELLVGIKQHEALDRERYDRENLDYRIIDKKIWDKNMRAAEKIEDDGDAQRRMLDLAVTEPMRPRSCNPILNAFTINGLFKVLETSPYAGLFNADGGSFSSGWWGQDDTRKIEMGANLSALWSGEEIKKVVGDEEWIVENRRFNMLLMMQHGVAAAILGDDALNRQGLIPRMLITQVPEFDLPDVDMLGTDDRAHEIRKTMDGFHEKIRTLYGRKVVTKIGSNVEVDPAVITLDMDAKTCLQDWFNKQHKPQLKTRYKEIISFADRAFEQVYRLAGTLAAFDGKQVIDGPTIAAAVCLVEMYLEQRLNLDMSTGGLIVGMAQMMLDWMETKQKKDVPLNHLTQFGPYRFRNLDLPTRKKVMFEMVKREWIDHEIVTGTDGKPSDRYSIKAKETLKNVAAE